MSDEPPADASRPRPTIMKAPAERSRAPRRVAAAPASPPLAASSGSPSPTVMAGVRRARLDVDAAQLRTVSPGAAPSVYAKAAQLIVEIVPDRMDERRAVLWGHEAQKAYADRVTGTFSLAQDPVLEQARAWVARMIAVLASIDLMAVCGHRKSGLLGRIATTVSANVDTPRELSAALDELRLLLDRTSAAIDRLLQLKDRLQAHVDAIAHVEVDVEAAAVAALYLAEHFQATAPHLGQRFTDRSMSLTATLAQMRQASVVHRAQIDQPLQLIASIQNVALVSLPGCIAGMSALLTLVSTKGASPTEARDVHDQLRELISNLTR